MKFMTLNKIEEEEDYFNIIPACKININKNKFYRERKNIVKFQGNFSD